MEIAMLAAFLSDSIDWFPIAQLLQRQEIHIKHYSYVIHILSF